MFGSAPPAVGSSITGPAGGRCAGRAPDVGDRADVLLVERAHYDEPDRRPVDLGKQQESGSAVSCWMVGMG